MKLFTDLGVDKDDVKGMGIVISKLDIKESNNGSSKLSTWFNKQNEKNQNSSSINDDSTTTVIEILDDDSNSNTNKSMNSVEQHYDQSVSSNFSLPSMSQIDWNEVSMLPDDIQNEILRELKSTTSANTTNNINRSRQTSNKIKKTRSKRRSSKSKVGRPRKKPVLGNNKDEHSRQINMKQMLKLADVKSGNHILKDAISGESVSLTQLEALPFELQLQVANNDSKKINNSLTSSIEEIDEVEVIDCDNTHDHKDENIQVIYAYEEVGDDIAALNEWMNLCASPSAEDVLKVDDYFKLCLAEHRLDDVIAMLRSIRNRDDEWKNDHFSHFVSLVNSVYFSKTKRVLDLQWLGLE